MNTNQSIERALDILECFSQAKSEIGLSELARLVGLPKATVFRMAETLVERGYLIKDGKSQAYQLGYKILRLGQTLLSNMDYRKIALPYMQKIRDETNESVTLYIPINDRERLCVERFQSSHGLRRIVHVGEIFAIDLGAAGKALLAFREAETLHADYRVTLEELAQIRRQGYALSHGERELGVSSVAVPLLDRYSRPIASLSVSGPEFRYHGEWLENIIEVTKRAAASISRELGCPG
ncbi:MAG: IclR family transcriptional regulator [Negativicutes bacterium]|nr:IclR family transcriptional regulator [Negativicutes bacterium]